MTVAATRPGIYGLLLGLASDTGVTVRSGRRFVLGGGTYVYVGSARGPGGLAARLSRHLRRDKPRHWHVDFLVQTATPLGYLCLGPALGECDLAALVASLPGVAPVPGFGCSDCRGHSQGRPCPGHLYRLPGRPSARELAAALAPLAAASGLPYPLLGTWTADRPGVISDGTAPGIDNY